MPWAVEALADLELCAGGGGAGVAGDDVAVGLDGGLLAALILAGPALAEAGLEPEGRVLEAVEEAGESLLALGPVLAGGPGFAEAEERGLLGVDGLGCCGCEGELVGGFAGFAGGEESLASDELCGGEERALWVGRGEGS